jgi:hypothetical protein
LLREKPLFLAVPVNRDRKILLFLVFIEIASII